MEGMICRMIGVVVVAGFAAYGFFTFVKKDA